ncbi:hypothetical protein MYCTH_2312648 [Thermothelomyces thermophilus ATCC 42464]|uniref:Cation/H+ exchanger transmembrane domain-containing protein n=1 Tax=Thermothelomyces thermophilus (strain ATCC 42464 / BCRC 31852 / DSM 1799) TaxID=573729 RepID=G2QN27_THET4|nr:uncharacterized protein MYCTH_2312648 [Thermothelomyces thermophilus ATCC 42464]AEO61900.1 hypothetical protein MYCTH_2312648 [Thermothelomyces thermophilus ATCC 42464]
MPTLATTNFNILLSVLGGWLSLFGSVSYLFKGSFYLSEAPISLLVGVALSPRAANFIRPLEYALGSPDKLASITLALSRLVLGVQLVLAGVQLPSRYLRRQWRPLALLVGPVMAAMWIVASLLVWALVPDLPLLHALAVGACVAPTDPVLSSLIMKGRFADRNHPKGLQDLVVAEAGANGALAYPFLFLALYLIKCLGDGSGDGSAAEHHGGGGGGARAAVGQWFGEAWGYAVLLGIVYGAVVGWLARELLRRAEERRFVDRQSFLVPAVSLALFVVGTCGMIGSDDALACFAAGSAFAWDDRFRLDALDDSLQPTADMLLTVPVFLWYGAVCPWEAFRASPVVPLGKLVALAVLVLLARRLPWVFLLHWFIPPIGQARQAVFVGFFGPVGVSAIFYLYVALGFLRTLDVDGKPRADVRLLPEAVTVVVWFTTICSTFIHGLSIPFGKIGHFLPGTASRDPSPPFGPLGSPASSAHGDEPGTGLRRSVFRARGSSGPKVQPRPGEAVPDRRKASHYGKDVLVDVVEASQVAPAHASVPCERRMIRLPDEPTMAGTRETCGHGRAER